MPDFCLRWQVQTDILYLVTIESNQVLKEAAKESKRSFNSEIVYALERHVQKGRKREKSVQVSPLSEEKD